MLVNSQALLVQFGIVATLERNSLTAYHHVQLVNSPTWRLVNLVFCDDVSSSQTQNQNFHKFKVDSILFLRTAFHISSIKEDKKDKICHKGIIDSKKNT